MTDMDYADLFTLVVDSTDSPVRIYVWGDYRIEWDAVFEAGTLYRVEGHQWVSLTPPRNELSFEQLARMAVQS